MMVENDLLSKENTVPNSAANSDDSYSGASFPWFPSQTKRKSRLGTHRKDRIRVLQDVIPNISSDLKPLALSQDVNIGTTHVSTSEPVETRYISPHSASVNMIEPISKISPVVNHFERPLPPTSHSTRFNAFDSVFDDFKPPTLSPHSTPMEIFESICSPPLPANDFKSISLSPASIPMDIPDHIGDLLPSSNDSDPSSLSSSMSRFSSSNSDSRTPSSRTQSIFVERKLPSNYECFKTPSLSPPAQVLESARKSASPPIKPAPFTLPPSSSVKPFEVARSIASPVKPSSTYNVNLKSSLKKTVSSPVAQDKPAVKPRETTPRKEVRFAEPAPPPKSVSQKPAKELPTHITVKDKTYKVWRELGTGGSCVVYEVFDPEMNDTLAIKRVSLPEEEDHAYVAEGYLQEVKMLEKLQTSSDVIIRMFDHELVYENDCRVLYVVLEKGEMDLSKYMRCISKGDKLHYILFCWRQMLLAVSKIHDEEIIHLDLKPANFLVVKGRLKLIDFGIASSMPGDKTSIYLEATSGTLNYTSPETLSMTYSPAGCTGYRISKKSDVWSLGCILYRWIYGHVPFHKSTNRWQRLQDIMAPDKKVDFPEREDVPEPLLRSLQSCLEKDPKKRPTVKELLQLKLEISLDQCMS